jgi:hypothetical protein
MRRVLTDTPYRSFSGQRKREFDRPAVSTRVPKASAKHERRLVSAPDLGMTAFSRHRSRAVTKVFSNALTESTRMHNAYTTNVTRGDAEAAIIEAVASLGPD